MIKDSGKRENFKSGAVRDIRKGKGRFDLLPFYALEELAKHFEEGSVKYGDNNWLRGMPQSRFLDSCLRHLTQFKQGKTDENHLRAAAWNIICMLDQKSRIERGKLDKSFNDL